MALIERDREPGAAELRWFGAMLVAFCGGIAALVHYRTGGVWLPGALGSSALLFALAYYAFPAIRRSSLRAWMALTYPIGWTVSHLVLAAFYFLVVTPIGLAMRLVGRDPLQRRLERDRASYWVERRPAADAARYWRQF